MKLNKKTLIVGAAVLAAIAAVPIYSEVQHQKELRRLERAYADSLVEVDRASEAMAEAMRGW